METIVGVAIAVLIAVGLLTELVRREIRIRRLQKETNENRDWLEKNWENLTVRTGRGRELIFELKQEDHNAETRAT